MTDVLLCTDRFLDAHARRLREAAPQLRVAPLGAHGAGDATIAFLSSDTLPDGFAPFLRAATDATGLRWLQSMSAGVDAPVFDTLLDRGVRLTTSAGASAPAIAHSVLLALLALGHDHATTMRDQQEHRWRWSRWRELTGRRIAVIGYGPIGRHVADLAAAFGMRPTIVRRQRRGDEPFPTVPLDLVAEVAERHDVVVLALPLTAETDGIMSRDVIGRMRDDATLVNVARGRLVDHDALTEALRDGRLGAAALDVTDPEPLPADHPLWDLPNVLITAHRSGSSDQTPLRVDEIFFDNLSRWVHGEPLRNEVVRPL